MSISDLQKQARTMVAKSKDLKTNLTYQQALELIASLNGFKTWAALKATYEKDLKKEKEEKSLKEKDPYLYYRLDYFAHVKDSGSYYILVDKKAFYSFSENFSASHGYKLDTDDLIIEYAVFSKQLDESDSGYIIEVEEIERTDFPKNMLKN